MDRVLRTTLSVPDGRPAPVRRPAASGAGAARVERKPDGGAGFGAALLAALRSGSATGTVGIGELALARAVAAAASPRADRAPAAGSMPPIRPVRQSDPSEYNSPAQARTWSGSTCSAAALTAVLRAQGTPARIAEVMQAMPGGLTPELGLVSRCSLVDAAARFGSVARDDVVGYAALQRAVTDGQPVLVDVRNQQFPEGHWMVVTSADERTVRVADSSGYALTSLSQPEFLAAWSGRGIRIASGPAPLGSRNPRGR